MLESGQELSARYVLIRQLGAGGHGEVWLAQDRERDELVALKILRSEWMRPEALEVLEREFAALSRLNHPHILRVHGLHRSAQHAWIAMEYVAGGDLSRLRGRSTAEVLRLVIPIASALKHA